jgi:hypothetical protein
LVGKLSIILIGDKFCAERDEDDHKTDDDQNIEEDVHGNAVEVKNSGIID